MKNLSVVATTLVIGTLLSACTQHEPPASVAPPVSFQPTATIQDIMLSIIDPNIDPVWNSVSTISTAKGTEERSPQTDEEWKVLRQHAITVVEASNLLLIDGRQAAPAGASTSIHPVELAPAEIEKLISVKREAFVERAHALHDAAQKLIVAIDAKDIVALDNAGGQVEHACEQCHSQFWYPNDKRPTAQLELGVQSGSPLYLRLRNPALTSQGA